MRYTCCIKMEFGGNYEISYQNYFKQIWDYFLPTVQGGQIQLGRRLPPGNFRRPCLYPGNRILCENDLPGEKSGARLHSAKWPGTFRQHHGGILPVLSGRISGNVPELWSQLKWGASRQIRQRAEEQKHIPCKPPRSLRLQRNGIWGLLDAWVNRTAGADWLCLRQKRFERRWHHHL